MSFRPALSFGRPAHLTLLVLATGALLTGTAATAGAAASDGAAAAGVPLLSVAGNTSSSAVSLALHLPAGAGSGVDNLQLGLLSQTGALRHDASGQAQDLATSISTLGTGTLFDAGGPLASANQTVRADLAHPSASTSPVLTVPSPLDKALNVGASALNVRSGRPPLATTGNSSVAGLSLGRLADLVPAGSLDALTQALTQVVGTATTATSTASGTALDTAQGALGGVLGSIDATLKQQAGIDPGTRQTLTTLKATLAALQADLTRLVGTLTSASVVDLRGLTTTHSVRQSGSLQVSTVETKLASLALLGGFVQLAGFDNAVTTQAGGVAGSAQTVLQPNLARVTVGFHNELSALLGPAGLQLSGLGVAVPAPVTAALNALQSSLNALLNVAGVQIQPDAVTANSAAKDGTTAAGALSGLRIAVAPPLLGASGAGAGGMAPKAAPAAPLVAVTIGSIAADSAARQLPAAAPAAPTTPLAYTGADLPVTGAIATALVGLGVLAARRRRQS